MIRYGAVRNATQNLKTKPHALNMKSIVAGPLLASDVDVRDIFLRNVTPELI
jgi:hypothetical protein